MSAQRGSVTRKLWTRLRATTSRALAARLSVAGLSGETRLHAVSLLAVIVAATLVVVAVGVGVAQELIRDVAGPGTDRAGALAASLPFGLVTTGTHGQVPVVAVALLYIAAATVAGALAHGVSPRAWPFPRATALGMTYVGSSMSTLLLLQVGPCAGSRSPHRRSGPRRRSRWSWVERGWSAPSGSVWSSCWRVASHGFTRRRPRAHACSLAWHPSCASWSRS